MTFFDAKLSARARVALPSLLLLVCLLGAPPLLAGPMLGGPPQGIGPGPVHPVGNWQSIRFANLYPGTDCGARIAAADASFAHPQGEIWVNRKCGMTISTWKPPRHSIRFIEGGAWTVKTTLLFSHGGITISGVGLNDEGIAFPGTRLSWGGPAGQDLFSILGTAAARLDKIVVEKLILDGSGSARYAFREEKADVTTVRDVRIRGGAVHNAYLVDTTGDVWMNALSVDCAGACLFLDWGTGQFQSYGLVLDQLSSNTTPLLVVQGAGTGQTFNGLAIQCTAGPSFAGFILVTGFDSNSSAPGAPPGGNGAPQQVVFNQPNITYNAPCPAASQGADIVISGTASNPVKFVALNQPAIMGASIGVNGLMVDQAQDVTWNGGKSNGHSGVSLTATNNSSLVRMEYVTSLDPGGRIGGTANAVVDCRNTVSGRRDCTGVQGYANGGSVDTGTSRCAAGVVCAGNGNQGDPTGEFRSARIAATYNAAGSFTTGVHLVEDSGTLSSGTAVVTLSGSAAYSSAASYNCVVSNKSNQNNSLKVTYSSGASFTVTGGGAASDAFSFLCVGN